MKSLSGFTLIELLIVMTVIGVALSLVGPVTLQQFDKAERVSEREKLFRIIEQVQYESFIKRQATGLEFSGRSITLVRAKQPQASWLFEHLSFPVQLLHINSHGFWQQSELTWLEQNTEHRHQLNPEPVQQSNGMFNQAFGEAQ